MESVDPLRPLARRKRPRNRAEPPSQKKSSRTVRAVKQTRDSRECHTHDLPGGAGWFIMRHLPPIMILPAAPDVLAAAHRLRGVIQRTPCSYSAPLSARAGAEVYLKWENQQHTGSFKLRGAFNALLTMPNEERRR